MISRIVVGFAYASRWLTFGIACGFHDLIALMQLHQTVFNKFTAEARSMFVCVFSTLPHGRRSLSAAAAPSPSNTLSFLPSFLPFPWLGLVAASNDKIRVLCVNLAHCTVSSATAGSRKPSHLPWKFHPPKQSLPSLARSLTHPVLARGKCSCHLIKSLTLPGSGTLQQCVVERHKTLLSWEKHRD